MWQIKARAKFYVAVDLEKGWLAQLLIVGLWVKICVDYEIYPIRCHFFMGFSHLIKDYPSLTTKKDWVAFFNSKGRLLGGNLNSKPKG
jgi:succinate dehydrogenase/fumarate reductase cytochrome b subunit